MSNYEASTLKKGLQILDLLQEERYLTLTEITKALNINKSTAFRLLLTLENMQYIRKKDHYYIWNAAKYTGLEVHAQEFDWTALKAPYQLGVSEVEGIYIGILDETEVVMRQMIKPPFEGSYQPEIGDRSLAHISAIGKVILANLTAEEQKKVFSNLPFSQATEQTFSDQELFDYHLDVIKKQGYALDDEERFVGLRCIAAPVFYEDKVVAAIAIAGPIDRMKKTKLKGLTNKVLAVSNEITKELSIRYGSHH